MKAKPSMKRIVFAALVSATGLWALGCSDNSGSENGDSENSGGDGDADIDAGDVDGGDGLFVTHDDAVIDAVPEDGIALAKEILHIAYQHTSHGSQLITGMDALASFPAYGDRFAWSDEGEAGALDLDDYGISMGGDDLSQGDSEDENGDTPWVVGTRELLDDPANSHINVIMWSWCSINGHDPFRYVNNMEKLIEEYPNVTFVFMTGHAEGTGEDLSPNGVHYNNQVIRNHCRLNHRLLFDFADIEAHDPDGVYYWDQGMYDNLDYDDGNWAVDWIADNSSSDLALLTTGEGIDGFDGTSGCAHSDSPAEANLNCVRKGAAVWNMFTRIAESL